MAVGRALSGYSVERDDGGLLKIEIIGIDAITAVTGAMGLAQRFNEKIAQTIRELRQPFQPPQQFLPGFGFAGTKVQQIFAGRLAAGVTPYDVISPTEIGVIIAETTIDDFKRTQSTHQISNGWGFGALFAFVHADAPQLIDFDPTQFHPELKGQPDPDRGDRNWRCVSWGIGGKMADAFLAHLSRVLFGDLAPTVAQAKLAVAWTVDHVRRYHPGLVGGKLQLAVLEKDADGDWGADHADPGEIEQQVTELEKYISAFREKQEPDAAADASAVDIDAALGTSAGSGGS
jgi:hypothetical protein